MTEDGNVWFVSIGSPTTCEDATEEEARDALAFIGGKLESTYDNGCFDAVLPKCLHEIMEADGYFTVSFDLGDNHWEITAEAK